LPIFIGGETYHHGNRKIDFYLNENKLIFKPESKIKIDISFICSKKQKNTLIELQNLIEQNNIIPVSVRISTDYVWIMFDEEILNGFQFKMTEYKKAVKGLLKDDEERKQIYKNFKIEQDGRKLAGKLTNRYLAVDLNPQYIGWSICDVVKGRIVIVDKGCYDLSSLSSKLGLSSTDPEQVYQNNKREFELCNVWKDLFNKAVHYKIGHFVCEELEFKNENVNDKAKEANRKTRNIWHRELTTNLINKYCNSFGIIKKEVNPVYSSFIGNIQNTFYDPVNASIEICRRGIYKFVKGRSLYPPITEFDRNTMSSLIQASDVFDKNGLLERVTELGSWKQAFDLFKQTKLRYRRVLNHIGTFRLFSFKSKILCYRF